jgi:hypothetical protein
MQQIKFRAWDKNIKKMYDFADICDYPIARLNHSVVFEFMQFSGLKDSKGKEIYENDILQDFRKTFKYKCVFRDENGSFEFQNLTTLNFCLLYELHNCEVIGNIFENSDLL